MALQAQRLAPGAPGTAARSSRMAVLVRAAAPSSVAVRAPPSVPAQQQEEPVLSSKSSRHSSSRSHGARRARYQSVSRSPSASPAPLNPIEPQGSLLSRMPQGAAAANTLKREEEVACCRIIQEAHRQRSTVTELRKRQQIMELATMAQRVLLASYRRYITLQAKRLQANMWEARKVPFEDIFLAGVLGLMEAAQRYQLPKAASATTSSAATSAPAPSSTAAAGASSQAGAAGRPSGGLLSTGGGLPQDLSSSLAASAMEEEEVAEALDSSSKYRGARFLTYAHFYIRKFMVGTLRDMEMEEGVFIPRYITDLRKRVAAAVEEVRSEAQSRGELPRVRAVAARAGVSPQAVLDLMHAASLTHVSLGGALDEDEEGAGGGLSEDQVGAGTSGAGLGGGSGGGRFLDDVSPMASSSSSLGGAGSGTPAAAPIAEALAQQEISSKALQSMLRRVLSEREVAVLWRTMDAGMGEQGGLSQQKVADELQISRQMLCKIHNRALKKLRNACAEGGELRGEAEALASAL